MDKKCVACDDTGKNSRGDVCKPVHDEAQCIATIGQMFSWTNKFEQEIRKRVVRRTLSKPYFEASCNILMKTIDCISSARAYLEEIKSDRKRKIFSRIFGEPD